MNENVRIYDDTEKKSPFGSIFGVLRTTYLYEYFIFLVKISLIFNLFMVFSQYV